MAIRVRARNGVLVPLSGYKKLKAFHSGGFFWDPLPQSLIRQFLGVYLPPVEVSQDNGETVGWFRRFLGTRELLSESRPLGRRSIPQEQIDGLRAALQSLQAAADAPDTQPHNRELITQFRLPHPERDPELYRLRGPVWDRHVEIIWGCEKTEDSSVAPSKAVNLLKPDRFYAAKRWLYWLLGALLAALVLYALYEAFKWGHARAINKPPVVGSVVRTEDLENRTVVVDDLTRSTDPDGKVVAHEIDWGDGMKELVPASAPRATRTYPRDGNYTVNVRAIDNLGRRSPGRTTPVALDFEQQQREAKAKGERREAKERAADLEVRKRAAEDAARIQAERKVVAEAAERARKEAEDAARKRIAEENEKAEAARNAEGARKAEEAAEAAAAAMEAAKTPSPQRAKPPLAPAVAPQSPKNSEKAAEPAPAGERSDFKDVTSGRPVRPISFKKPSYPRQALQSNAEGFVQVNFTVGTDGKTKDLKVVGEENGIYFRQYVFESVRRATFKPAIIDGVAVEQVLAYEVKFVITD